MLVGLKRDEQQVVEVFGEVPDFMRTHLSSREFLYVAQINAINQTGRTLKYELNGRDNGAYIRELPLRAYDHHLTHAAAAAYTSAFDEASAACSTRSARRARPPASPSATGRCAASTR